MPQQGIAWRDSFEIKLLLWLCLVKVVRNRYYLRMARPPKVSQRAVAELVSQVGRIAYGDGFIQGLTESDFYFAAKANRSLDELSAQHKGETI